MAHTRTATTAVIGSALVGLLLSGCTAFGGDDTIPAPTRQSSQRTAEPAPAPTATTRPVAVEQAVPAGTVAAETDVVSPSGDTSLHVRIVANDRGTFDAQLSDYRTTNPQQMSVEFRHRHASPLDGADAVARDVREWTAASGPPRSFTMTESGGRPDYLRSVVLVPTSVPDEDPAERPWVGSVLAAADLEWNLPDPYPDLRVTVGKDRPGAYGTIADVEGRPADYRVAHGDELSTVAERFGITQEQVLWLNPYADPRDDDWLLEGSLLNIDPARR